jgi:hypothetical protein
MAAIAEGLSLAVLSVLLLVGVAIVVGLSLLVAHLAGASAQARRVIVWSALAACAAPFALYYIWGLTGDLYFARLCSTEGGVFIRKTVDDVDGIFQMRPRDTKDYYDRVRAGDIPPDPYGYVGDVRSSPWGTFEDYRFVEMPIEDEKKFRPTFRGHWHPSMLAEPKDGQSVARYLPAHPKPKDELAKREGVRKEFDVHRKSNYGYTWRVVDRSLFHIFRIYGGETVVVDLRTGEELAVRRGFMKYGFYGTCPKDEWWIRPFIKRVLIPRGD